MAGEVADLTLRMRDQTQEAQGGLEKVKGHLDDIKDKGKEAAGTILGFASAFIGIKLGEGVFSTITDTLKDSVQAASQSQLVQSQLAAALKSTNDASGQTSESMNALAENLSKTTTFSKDTTLNAEVLALRFTNIGTKVFPQVIEMAQNVSTRLGISLPAALKSVGAAIDDPASKFSSLSRLGIVLDKQQQELVKHMVATGDSAGAQAYLLGLLQTRYGGAADAAGNTFAGKLQILQNSFEEMRIQIGNAIIPLLSQLLTALSPLINAVGNDLVQGLSVVTGWITNFQSALQSTNSPVSQVMGAFKGLEDVLENGVQPYVRFATQAFLLLWPTLQQVFQALAPLGPQFEAAFKAASNAGSYLSPLLTAGYILINLIQELAPPIAALVDQVGGALLDAFTTLAPILATVSLDVQNQLVPAFFQVVQFIEPLIPLIGDVLTTVITALVGIFRSVANEVENELVPALAYIIPIILPIIHQVAQWVGQLLTVLIPAIQLVGAILQAVIPWAIGVLIRSFEVVAGIVQFIWPSIQAIISAVINNLVAIIQFFSDLFHGNWGKLWGDILNIVTTGMQGTWNVIKTVIGSILGLFGGMIGGVLGALGNFIGGLLGFFGNAFGDLFGAIGSGIQSAIDYFVNFPGGVLAALVALPGDLLELGQTIMLKLAGGIYNAAGAVLGALGWVKDQVTNILGDIKNNLTSGLNSGNVFGGGGGLFNVHLPHFAAGTLNAPGGPALVGEGNTPELIVGPHLANLVSGAGVIPLPTSAGGGGSGNFSLGGSQQIIVMLDSQVLTQAVIRNTPREVWIGTGMRGHS